MILLDKKNPLATLIAGWLLILLVGVVGVFTVIITCSRPHSVQYKFTRKSKVQTLAPFKAVVFNYECDDPDASFSFSGNVMESKLEISGSSKDFSISAPRDMFEEILTTDVKNDTLYVNYHLEGPKLGYTSYNRISQLEPVIVNVPDSSLTSVSCLSSYLPVIWLKSYKGDEIELRTDESRIIDCQLEKMTFIPTDKDSKLYGSNTEVALMKIPVEYHDDSKHYGRDAEVVMQVPVEYHDANLEINSSRGNNFNIKTLDVFPASDSITQLRLSLYQIGNDSLRIDPAVKYTLEIDNIKEPRNSSDLE